MATVPLSEKLRTEIKERATEPFTKIIAETEKLIATDWELGHQIRRAMTSPEEALRAETLWKANPIWTTKYASSVFLTDGADDKMLYTLDGVNQPYPVASWRNLHVDVQQHPMVRARMEQLQIPRLRAIIDRNALNATLDSIFEAVPTLQRAVEVLPSILEWVSDDVRAKYNAPHAKRSRERIDPATLRDSALSDEAKQAIARGKIK